jgi:TonB family protein
VGWPRSLAWAALSAGVHVFIVRMLPSVRLQRSWPVAAPIEIDLGPRAHSSAPLRTPRLPPGPLPVASLRARHEVTRPSLRLASETPRTESPPSPESSPAEPARPDPLVGSGAPDLFPAPVLDRLAATQPIWGGTTRRDGDGRPPPSATDGERDNAEASARLQRWMRELGGEDDARAGRVDPGFRDLERQIDSRFRPRAEQVTDENRLQLLGRQLRNRPDSGPTPRGVDPSVAAELGTFVADQISASQRAFAEPGRWFAAEIELLLDADGRIVDATLVVPSGRAALDRLALEAVRRAASARPPRDPRGPTRSRWSVEAAVAVTPPTANPIVDPVSGQVQGAVASLFSLRFDESTGKVGVDYAFRKEVRTHVRLLSVEAR